MLRGNGGIMPRRNISRRQLFRTSASALLAANLWPGRLFAAEKDSGTFDFVIINDIHYVDDADGKWLADVVVKSIREQAEKPDFIIIAGDLSEDGSVKQVGGVKTAIGALKLPLYVVVGNHDYVPKTKNRAAYEQLFPKSINYAFEHKGWNFVALDSTDGVRAQANVLPPTMNWVDQNLKKIDKARPMLLLTHFPLGPGVSNRSLNADALLDKFKGHNLSCVFGGHHHGFTEKKVGEVVLTTNRCCSLTKGNHDGTKEKGYFVCSAKEGKVGARFVQVA
jgi:3',5'-cyclic AMP phosphodiesterase CpdA